MATHQQLISDLEKLLHEQKLKNLKMKMHIVVLVTTPRCATASKLREKYSATSDITGPVLNLN